VRASARTWLRRSGVAAAAAGVGVLTAPAGFAHAAPPLAANSDSATIVNPLKAVTGNVLANDVGPDGGAAAGKVGVRLAKAPSNGSVTINSGTGAFRYIPGRCDTGDSFTYEITDVTDNANSDVGTVTISASAGAVQPDAVNDSFSVPASGVRQGNLLGNDCGPIALVSPGGSIKTAHGRVILESNGRFTYQRDAGDFAAATDSFSYDVVNTSNSGLTASASVTLSLPAISPPSNPGGGNNGGGNGGGSNGGGGGTNGGGGGTSGSPSPQGGSVPQTAEQGGLGELLGGLVPQNNSNPGTRNTTGASPRPQLPATGASNVLPTTLTGIGLVAAGAAALALSRRRRLVEAVEGPAEASDDTQG
jgi:LPXTG-motif cell wall-anchored protein